MLCASSGELSPLARRIEDRVRQMTSGRIRDLLVEERQGRVVIRGQVPSYHTKQLALHGALELISGDCRLAADITVA